MFKCIFCGHEFQGTQFVAARHFKQGKGCPQITDEALVDIHYNTNYKMDNKQLKRLQRCEKLHGAAPTMDADGGAGGEGQSGAAGEEDGGQGVDDAINVEGDAAQQRGEEPYTQRTGKGLVGESSGKRKEREGGGNVAPRKKMRQAAIKDVFSSQWLVDHKKKFLLLVYSHRSTSSAMMLGRSTRDTS
ncbi:hypothetical protein CBR_g20256 [Chara braunii]|uniref:Uncharacterized protein n=1 Tax=Chara braunii TaxID=69332 RepID=A0A388KZZ1_CHABU|nr:hypothetical protein CBR_g20256 [Chara braunii]|eukprot:GBG75626.1 hypothetical protein CBR_g20256 [Chara braunii]